MLKLKSKKLATLCLVAVLAISCSFTAFAENFGSSTRVSGNGSAETRKISLDRRTYTFQVNYAIYNPQGKASCSPDLAVELHRTRWYGSDYIGQGKKSETTSGAKTTDSFDFEPTTPMGTTGYFCVCRVSGLTDNSYYTDFYIFSK